MPNSLLHILQFFIFYFFKLQQVIYYMSKHLQGVGERKGGKLVHFPLTFVKNFSQDIYGQASLEHNTSITVE